MVAPGNGRNLSLSSALSIVALAFAMAAPAHALGVAGSALPDHSLQQAQVPLGNGNAMAPKYLYLFSPSAHWQGALRWKYNHANAPQPLAGDKAGVIAQIQKSFDKWTSGCGITYQYDGETTTPPNALVNDANGNQLPDGASVVGWGALDPSLGGWTYAWYTQSGNQRVIFDADVTLSVTNVTSLSALDRLMTHEWGHALGLDHSNVEAATMAGPPLTQYNTLFDPQPDDLRGCHCLYGLSPGSNAAYACSLPATVDFGDAAIGLESAPQTFTLTNSGNVPLTIQTSAVADPQFHHVAGCLPGAVVMPGASCTVQVTATPANIGAIASKLALFTNDGYYELALAANGVQASSAAQPPIAGPTVDVIEFYNATLDHYFITWIAAEIANLDAGLTPTRWTRTGLSFKAHASPQSGTSPICRFYIPPADGNSHFFGRGAGECAATQQAHPDFILEDANYMQMYLPAAGTCPAGTGPVYRVYNNRTDANHRYTADRTVRDQMVAKGWLAEGDGPDRVVMCAPL